MAVSWVRAYLICLIFRPSKVYAWKNAEGMTDTIRKHMIKEHSPVWCEFVLLNHLKGWETVNLPKAGTAEKSYDTGEFTLTGFYERLVRWIVADDQVSPSSGSASIFRSYTDQILLCP